MPYNPNLGSIGRASASYRVARGVMELFVDSSTADRQLNRFFNDTDQGMSASAQRAARLFSLGFTRGTDGIIRDTAGRIIDPNDPRLVINSQRAGRRFWGGFFRQGRQQSQQFFDGLFGMTSFTRVFQGMPPQAQAAIASSIAGAIYAGAAVIGAALDAVILAAIGGGVMAVGIASAVRDDDVRRAFQGVGQEFSEIFNDMGKPFVEPLISAADTFRTRVMLVRPEFREMAQELSGLVMPLADGIDALIHNMMPGLRAAVHAAVPVLTEFVEDLPALGDALSEMFGSIAAGDGAVKGMRVLMLLLSGTLILVGNTIEWLSNQFDDITNDAESFFSVMEKIPGIGIAFREVAEWLRDFNNTADKTVGVLGYTAKGFAEANTETAKAARAAAELKQRWHDLWGEAMTLDQALISYEESLDKLTESVKENGRSLDIGTDKGRNNARALLEVAENALRVRDAELAAGKPVDATNSKFAQQIEQLRNTAYALGFTRAQVDALLAKYLQYANAPVNVNKQITMTIRTVYKEVGTRPGGLNNVRYFERWGGVTTAHARHGLLTDADVFQAGSQPLISFAEPETGQEAFIPKNGNRERNMAVLRTAADWNNADVVPRAPGASALSMAGEVAARSRQARRGPAGPPGGTHGPYVIQVGDRVLTAFVVDVVTGHPTEVAAAADEGRRRTTFTNSGIAR